MISRESKVDINYFHRQRLSYREISRKTGRDRRTVKRYAEHPELIGQARGKVERPSILDEFRPVVEGWLGACPSIPEYRVARIYDAPD